MLCACNEAVEPYLPRSGSTIKNWVVDEFEKVKNEVRVQLLHAQSKVHISFDLWSSPSGYSLCGIVAHFVGYQNTVQHCLIGMKRMGCSHSGENIAAEVIPVLEEFELQHSLGVFVSDNVESNDTAVDTAVDALVSHFSPGTDAKARRGRCLGHIINLAAKAFIFGQDVEVFEMEAKPADNDAPVDLNVLKRAQLAWRKRGPIGKLHNVVIFIRSSPQRREYWKMI